MTIQSAIPYFILNGKAQSAIAFYQRALDAKVETLRRFGCDDFVSEPTLEAWRGVTVRADAATVWARVRQVRLAPYSYDVVDNLGRRFGAADPHARHVEALSLELAKPPVSVSQLLLE